MIRPLLACGVLLGALVAAQAVPAHEEAVLVHADIGGPGRPTGTLDGVLNPNSNVLFYTVSASSGAEGARLDGPLANGKPGSIVLQTPGTGTAGRGTLRLNEGQAGALRDAGYTVVLHQHGAELKGRVLPIA